MRFRYDCAIGNYDDLNIRFSNISVYDQDDLRKHEEGIRSLEAKINSVADKLGLEKVKPADFSVKASRERKIRNDEIITRFLKSHPNPGD